MAGPLTILLAEDNPDHVELTVDALRAVDPESRILQFDQGEAVLDYLRALPIQNPSRWPDLIMLDIKMPRLNGKEVLQAIKAYPLLQRLPVLMITTSTDDRERAECLALGAAGYLVKPISPAAFIRQLRPKDRWKR